MKRKNQSVSTRQQTRRKHLKIEIPVIEQQKQQQLQQPSRPTTFFPPDFHLQSFPQYLLQQQKPKQVVVKKKPNWMKEWQDKGYIFKIE